MIKSHLLYRLSYERTSISKNGASDRNRTGDNHVGNVMLYQLSYTRLRHESNIDPFAVDFKPQNIKICGFFKKSESERRKGTHQRSRNSNSAVRNLENGG